MCTGKGFSTSTVVIGQQLETVPRFSRVLSGSSKAYSGIYFFTDNQLYMLCLFEKRHAMIYTLYAHHDSFKSYVPSPKSSTKAAYQIQSARINSDSENS
jgi:hypothetical protein